MHIARLKVIGFVWSACLDRIPSTLALARKGIHISSLNCYFCSTGVDESNHLLVGCHFANEVLRWIFQWCNIRAQKFVIVSELVLFVADWVRRPKKRHLFLVIIYGFLWYFWKARNDLIFKNMRTSSSKLSLRFLVGLNIKITLVFVIRHTGFAPHLTLCNCFSLCLIGNDF